LITPTRDKGRAHPAEPSARATAPKVLARELVTGAWIAIPTPFTADGGQIDEELLAASVEHYVGALGVDGIFCGGVMGEFWALTLSERMRLHELVAEQVRGRVPLIAQVGHHAFADTVALCEHAQQHGVDIGIAMNPYYPPSPPDGLVRNWYERLAEATTLPMFLFNTTYSGYTLSPELIAELADLDNVCGIKNPQPREHLLRVQELAGDRIVVTDASERQWLELHTEHGIRSLMATPSLALYQTAGNTPVADYTRKADEGDVAGAREISNTLGPARDAFDRWMRAPWVERRVIPIAQLKAWLGLMGLPQGPVRPPLMPLSRDEQAELRSEVERLELIP
jgi:4-hydroxy-tetrahydrodipicolinate synthase